MLIICIRSPLPLSVDVPYVDGYPSLANPELLDVLIETPGLKRSTKEHHLSYLSFAPPEVMSHIVLFLKRNEIAFIFCIKQWNIGSSIIALTHTIFSHLVL